MKKTEKLKILLFLGAPFLSVLLQHTDTFSLSELKIEVSLNTSLCKGKTITLRFVIKNRKKRG